MVIFNLAGYPPSTTSYALDTLVAEAFTGATYTLASASLTGLSKSIQLSLGAYGYAQPQRTTQQNGAANTYGALILFEAATTYIDLHVAAEDILFAPVYTNPSYTLTSNSLTGLSKSTIISFGGYGHAQIARFIRRDGVGGTVVVSGVESLAFTPIIANTFALAGSTTVVWSPTTADITVTVAGSETLTITGLAGNQFLIAGSELITLLGFTASTFEVDGATTITFSPSAGQLASCVSGAGTLAGATAVGNATH